MRCRRAPSLRSPTDGWTRSGLQERYNAVADGPRSCSDLTVDLVLSAVHGVVGVVGRVAGIVAEVPEVLLDVVADVPDLVGQVLTIAIPPSFLGRFLALAHALLQVVHVTSSESATVVPPHSLDRRGRVVPRMRRRTHPCLQRPCDTTNRGGGRVSCG